MKNLGKKLILFGITIIFVFSFIACAANNNEKPNIPPDNQTTLPGDNDEGGDGTDKGDIDYYQDYYQNLKSVGFSGDYDNFLSVISGTVPYVMPSDNGYVTVISREQSPYRSQFHDGNGYIFVAQPVSGYYFSGWEAYNSHGDKVETARTIHDNNEQYSVEYNVIGDYSYTNESIRFVRAVFTNDESMLVSTPKAEFEFTGDEDSLQIAALPAKMVKGTALYQLAIPADGYYITNWSSFYAAYETMPGHENIIIGGNNVRGSLYNDDYKHLVFTYDERSVYTGRNSTFGIPDKFYITTQRQEDVIPIFVSHSSLYPTTSPYLEPTNFYFVAPQQFSSHNVEFVTRGHGLYLEPRGQYDGDKFYGWYDWDGNLLSTNYVYIDENFNEDVLYIQYRTGYFDERLYLGEFGEITDYLRFNPIKDGTEWEVAYNHDNNQFIDVLEIPDMYNGKPVTRIADRGFAKSWVRDTDYPSQWWFFQSHPLIGRLVVPKTIKEVGDFAFATLHTNVSTSSLTHIMEDTDGDNWTDTHTDITFEIEFLSAQTKVTPYTFSQSGNTFIGIKAQLSQILNLLLDIYIDVDSGAGFNGEGRLSLNYYPEQFDGEENPWAIYLSQSMLEKSNGRLICALFYEFRCFMQLVAVGNIEGANLKIDSGEQYKALVGDSLQNYIPSGSGYDEQFIVQDAGAFAYAWFGCQMFWSNLIVSA